MIFDFILLPDFVGLIFYKHRSKMSSPSDNSKSSLTIPETHNKKTPDSFSTVSDSSNSQKLDKNDAWNQFLQKKDPSTGVITTQPRSIQLIPPPPLPGTSKNASFIKPEVVVTQQPLPSSMKSLSEKMLGKNINKKYYEGNADQFLRIIEPPPVDEDGFAEFEPECLGPDLCIIFRRMLNYKFRNKTGHILKPLEDLDMLCIRALPDVPVAIEFAKEVDENARMRPRSFALCGEDMLPKYYAIEYTPPKIALMNCICCMSCFRQPFNIAIYGLDGQLAFRVVSAPLENCWCLRYSKECCCHKGVVKRMLIKMPDGAVAGSLVEFGHCFMTQWLQIHPGVPQTGADLADAAVVQWQSKCRCLDSTMLYCGCKTDPNAEGAMIMSDRAGRKYATARPWSGISSEDSAFLFTVQFTQNCPVEMKALALAGSFIYNNLNWETKTDFTCCMLISCLFCTLRLWYDGGPITYDYDNWSNYPTSPATSYMPWLSINRPAVVNHHKV